jgi:molybdopterin molybdotransferase
LEGRILTAQNELRRRPGRTEFVPARQVRTAHGELVEFLGRGGTARLVPLSHAEELACIEADRASVLVGQQVRFIPFDDNAIFDCVALSDASSIREKK